MTLCRLVLCLAMSAMIAAAAAVGRASPAPARTPTLKRPAPSPVTLQVPRRPLAPGDRISLDVKDADIRDVLRTFGRLARMNLVIDPEVRGSVTVSLHDVRWEDALEVILRSNGLASVRENTLVRVGTPPRLAPEPER